MKYPIGIQTFSEIIEQDYVYVDKTALIHQLITQGKWYFLSRPRRFGKSLLVSTLEADVKTSMNAFYGVVKALDEHLHFIFITGVSKFSKVSVFSGMNNLDDISMRKDYCALCGYTQQELENYFEHALTSLAATEKKEPETVKAEVKQWYNGYRFHRSGTTVYNPHSILSLCKNQEFDNFWFQSATPTFLIERLKAKQYLLSDLENVYLSPEGLNASEPENTSIQSLFVQTGYLTITSWTGTLYQLDFPNREVRDSFYKSIVEHLHM